MAPATTTTQGRPVHGGRPIVCIGDLAADLVVAVPTLPIEADRHQLADAIRVEPGGCANVLLAGARLGQPMAALGAVGEDEWGRTVSCLLRAEGIDLSGVVHEGTTTTVVVLAARSGGHVFVGKYGDGIPMVLDAGRQDLIERAAAVYCSGYALCEERLQGIALAALQRAWEMQIPVFFDPGPLVGNAPPSLLARVLRLTDTILLTEEEVSLLGTDGDVGRILEAPPHMAVIKQGPQGCTIQRAGEPAPGLVSPGYRVDVVDTAAAGDSFNAAFMTAWLRGWRPEDCARLANAAGAAKVRKQGTGPNVPTRADVQAIIEQFDIRLPAIRDGREAQSEPEIHHETDL